MKTHWTDHLPQQGYIAERGKGQKALASRIERLRGELALLEQCYEQTEAELLALAQQRWPVPTLTKARRRATRKAANPTLSCR